MTIIREQGDALRASATSGQLEHRQRPYRPYNSEPWSPGALERDSIGRKLTLFQRKLMKGTPADCNLDDVVERVEAIDGVKGLHHVHVWELDERNRALEAHVVIVRDRAKQQAAIKRRVKQCLSSEFQIQHSTLEFEFDDEQAVGDHDTSVVAEH